MSTSTSGRQPTRGLGEDAILVQPIVRSTPRFYLFVGALSCISALGVVAYIHQFRSGLGVTGLNRPVYWGVYITNFVFFVGISHAGTLISASLRIVGADWRRSVTTAVVGVEPPLPSTTL